MLNGDIKCLAHLQCLAQFWYLIHAQKTYSGYCYVQRVRRTVVPRGEKKIPFIFFFLSRDTMRRSSEMDEEK